MTFMTSWMIDAKMKVMGFTPAQVAELAGVNESDVFDAIDNLDGATFISVCRIAKALNIKITVHSAPSMQDFDKLPLDIVGC